MTVKRRLALSNVIMIVIPVVITLCTGLLCLAGIYITMEYSNGFGFESGSEFYNISQVVSDKVDEIFEDGNNVQWKLKSIGNVIDTSSIDFQVYKDNQLIYCKGNTDVIRENLKISAKNAGSSSFVADGRNELYYWSGISENSTYELYLFSDSSHHENIGVRNAVIFSACILLITVIISVYFTNRFLIHFVFENIETPLDILSKGVKEISDGNLEYRICYEIDDEFKPVCTVFNEMAERLKKSVEESKKNDENRKEMLLDISHDIRSPLTSIQAYVEGILDGIADTPEMRQKYLQTIKRKTTDIEKMITSLSAFSKLDMNAYIIDETNAVFPVFFEEYIRKNAEDISVKLEVNADDVYTCKADTELLERITFNVLNNSMKYGNQNNPECRILICEDEGYVRIEFADNGPGVEEENLEHLFDIFYRTDKARSHTGNGSGIGLSFVKKATELMGGHVKAMNNEMGGLSIVIYLRCVHEKNIDC